MRIVAGTASLLLLTLVAAANDGADAVVGRTRTTSATYATYSRVFALTDDGDADNGWAAEFHSGDWHRNESAKFRVIANCRTHVGYAFDVESQQLQKAPDIYKGACGIVDAPDVIATDRLAPVTGKYGRLDVVRITDTRFTRFYAIDAHGVIVRSIWSAKNGSPAPCFQIEPNAIMNVLPAGNIFSVASLKDSVVPTRYRVMRQRIPDVGLSGKSCGLAR